MSTIVVSGIASRRIAKKSILFDVQKMAHLAVLQLSEQLFLLMDELRCESNI